MPGERGDYRCVDCGAALALFAPACPGCGGSVTWTAVPCDDCGTSVDHAEPGTCPDCQAPVSPWDAVVRRARTAGFHVPLPVSDAVPHPGAAGFTPGRGKPAGQKADYRRPLPDGTEVHVRVYDDHYEAHLDRRSAEDWLAHLARDAPLETAVGTTALSLLVLGAQRFRGGSGGATRGRVLESTRGRFGGLAARAASALPRPSVAARLRRDAN